MSYILAFLDSSELNTFIPDEYRYLIIASLLAGIIVGFTAASIYESFGPNANDLRDPFEEHED